MNTCETCKHWGPNMGGLGSQKKIMGKCNRLSVGGLLWLADRSGPAAIIDDTDGESGCLVTNPSFGCVLHAEKGQ